MQNSVTASPERDGIPNNTGERTASWRWGLNGLLEIRFLAHLGNFGETLRQEAEQRFCVTNTTTTQGKKPCLSTRILLGKTAFVHAK